MNPFRGSSFARIFSTHPSMESRVHRLEELSAEMGRPWRLSLR